MLTETELVARVTGPGSANRTDRFGVHGTDLGITWDADDGRTLIVFGDTYGERWGGHGAGPREADWRCNVLGYCTNRDLSAGLTIDSMVARPDGHARQIIERDPRVKEETVIPCSGISIGGKHYLQYMSVRTWSGPRRWYTNYGGIAVSSDGGATWDKPSSAIWRNHIRSFWRRRSRRDSPFQMGAFARADNHLYLLGTPSGRLGHAYLARVSPDHVLDRRAYEYWTGATWHPSDEYRAQPVMRGPVGELSVIYSAHARRWLAIHLDESLAALVLRTATDLAGPWTDPLPLVTGQEFPALYGGFLHPVSATGPDVYFTMSQWGPYNVFLMRTRLTFDNPSR
ncbi:DUF4185 domain-containing protein [Actinokineospora enzanensis]|uniref:DUF4185 domain-containing protein n=1 Tax=Actinokineospora enzanensis TaxID=155975 RepID=UPI00037FF849|nr:DUF4185 domain-containing protein [Actinokineospora enzanensis]